MEQIIKKKLFEIEQKEHVKIIMAVESGSRAWGFASPDSDWDVRFLYIRRMEDYLRLDPVRDVIEWQLDEKLDINGWDMKKALQLLHHSNPAIFEWCASPIVYRGGPEFEKFKELLPEYFSVQKSLYHYQSMAKRNYQGCLKDMVRVKTYFHVLRPLLAAKWVMDWKCPPPMLFSDLMETELEKGLIPEVERLLEMKRSLPEMGDASKISVLNEYIEATLDEVRKATEKAKEMDVTWDKLNAYFLELNLCGIVL